MAIDREFLTEDALLSILRKEEQAAQSFIDSSLVDRSATAFAYYNRDPYGDEQEGASSVVTSEFADTIESVMPGMMRVFTGTEFSVEFTPSARGEEQAAKEASAYVPHCLMRENDGFRILYWWIKDALMYRLGAVTVDIAEIEKVRVEPIEHMSQDTIAMIVAKAAEKGDELELDLQPDPEASLNPATPDQMQGPAPLPVGPPIGGQPAPVPQEMPQPMPGELQGPGPMMPAMMPPAQMPAGYEPPGGAAQTVSGTATITERKKQVIVDNIAVEDILISEWARDQDQASFLGYRKRTTASDLVKLGLDPEQVDELSSDRTISTLATVRIDGMVLGQDVRNVRGDSERPLWVVQAYVRVDMDGDGISEMLRVVYAHAGGTASRLIEAQEWDDLAWMALASPILMSHAVIGRSLFDQTQDLQQIGSALTRGMLDNLYFGNRPRPSVSDQVILDSLLDWTPGSPIRFKPGAKPGDGHIVWQTVPPIIDLALKGLEYFEGKREDRTGIVRHNQGLEADTLNKTASGMSMLMSAASQRQELMARTLAETAVKRLYRLVYRAIKKAAQGDVEYYSGQEFKTVNPMAWPDDMDLTLNVGAGTRDQALQGLATIAGMQEKAVTLQGSVNGPLVTAEHVANAAQRVAEALGYKTPGLFFALPQQAAQAAAQMAAQPKPDPLMAKVQADAQAQMAKVQADAQAKGAQIQLDQQHNQQKLAADIQMRQQEAAVEIQLTREKAAADLQTAQEQAALDMQVSREKAAFDLQAARERAALDAQLKREEMELEAQLEAMKIATMPKPGNVELQQQEVSGGP